MKKGIAADITTSFLILLFIYTGLSKLLNHSSFQQVLEQGIFKKGAAVIAILLPLSEILTALLLLFSATRLIGLYASLILLSVFTVYIALLLFVPHLPCSCGGVIGKMSWKWHVGFNGVFIWLTAWGIRKELRG